MPNADAELNRRGRKPEEASTPRWVASQVLALLRQYGSQLIWADVALFLIRETGQTFQAFAGRTSVANVILGVAAHLNATVAVSVTLAGVTGVLYVTEFRRHKKTRERLTKRVTELEEKIDPNRTSSQLTTKGMTRIGD